MQVKRFSAWSFLWVSANVSFMLVCALPTVPPKNGSDIIETVHITSTYNPTTTHTMDEISLPSVTEMATESTEQTDSEPLDSETLDTAFSPVSVTISNPVTNGRDESRGVSGDITIPVKPINSVIGLNFDTMYAPFDTVHGWITGTTVVNNKDITAISVDVHDYQFDSRNQGNITINYVRGMHTNSTFFSMDTVDAIDVNGVFRERVSLVSILVEFPSSRQNVLEGDIYIETIRI
eukprot:1861441-Rhodomonas_salina.3